MSREFNVIIERDADGYFVASVPTLKGCHTHTLADVYAALAYYHDHFEEISQQIQEDEKFAREMQQKTPSLVQQKLKQQNVRR